ncbi:MAG: hypothetical protein AAFQ64_15425 [Pseudomonadota bacterium]
MRWFFAAISALSLSGAPALADSHAPFWGESETLVFLSETEFTGPNGTQSLCGQVNDHHIAYLPIRRNIEGYYFADRNCSPESLVPIPESRFAMLQEAGLIPASAPSGADMSVTWSASQRASFAIILLLAALTMLALHRASLPRTLRMRNVSGDPLYFDVLLSVMFHTARTDGVIEKDELTAIHAIYHEITGAKLSPEVMAAKFTEVFNDDGIISLARVYRGREAEVLLDAAILVATRQGKVTREKMNLLVSLNHVLERDPNWFRDTINGALYPKGSQEA